MDRNLYSSLNQNVVMVDVAFQTTPAQGNDLKLYTYKARVEMNLAEGDMVVVPVTRNGVNIFAIAKVMQLDTTRTLMPNIDYKWIADRVDLTLYNHAISQEEEFNEAVLRLARKKAKEDLLSEIAKLVGESEFKSLSALINKPIECEHRTEVVAKPRKSRTRSR